MQNIKNLKQYKKDGFLILRNFLKDSEKNDFSSTLIKVYSKCLGESINPNNIHLIINKLEKEKKYDLLYRAFQKYCKSNCYKKLFLRLKSLAKKIHKNKKFKIVNTGLSIGLKSSKRTAYKWHQEKPYYKNLETVHFQFPVLGICNKKNGTMSVLKSSHSLGFQKNLNNYKIQKIAINSFVPKNITKLKKQFKEVHVSLNKKDIVMFNQYLLHKTNNNKSNKIRFAGNMRLKVFS